MLIDVEKSAAAPPMRVEGVKTSQRRPLHGMPGDLDFHLEVTLNMNPRPPAVHEIPLGRKTSFAIIGLGNEGLGDASNDLLFGDGGVLPSLVELNCGKFLGSTESQTALLGLGQRNQDWVLHHIKNMLFEGNDVLPGGQKADVLRPCDFNSFKDRLKYFQENATDPEGDNVERNVQFLNDQMQVHDAGTGVRIYYLALPQRNFHEWSEAIARQAKANPGVDPRVLLEPLFASDTVPASLLQGKQEVYFADHYGAKHMMKVMTSFRQMNAFIDGIWNGQTFDRVRILDHLDSNVKNVGSYFNNVGQVREKIASHLLQILALTAMELPSTIGEVAPGRLKVLEACKLRNKESSSESSSIFGQYRGFLEEKGLAYNQDQAVPTYARLTFDVDLPRWKTKTDVNVPFIVESGRGLGASFLEVRLEQGQDGCALVVRVEGLRQEEKTKDQPTRRIHVEKPELCSFRYEMNQMLREGSLTKPVSSLVQAKKAKGAMLEKESFLGHRAEPGTGNLVDATSLGMGKGSHVVLKYDSRDDVPSAYARLFQAAFEGRTDEYVSGREMQRQLEIVEGYEMPSWDKIHEYSPCTSEEARSRACPVLQAPMTEVLASDMYNCESAAPNRCAVDFYFSKCQRECKQQASFQDDPEEFVSRDEARVHAADREELKERGQMSLMEATHPRFPRIDDSEVESNMKSGINLEPWEKQLIDQVKAEISAGRDRHESAIEIIQHVHEILEQDNQKQRTHD